MPVTQQPFQEFNFFMYLLQYYLVVLALWITSGPVERPQGCRHFPALPRGCGCSFTLTHWNHWHLTPRVFPSFLCTSAEPADRFAIQTPLLPCQAAACPYVGLSDAGTTPGKYHYSRSCFPSVLCLMEQSHISLTPDPQVYAVSKMGISPVLNPGLDEIVTAASKLSEFILRMSQRLLSPPCCSPSQPFLFLSLTFSTLVFSSLCIYLLLIVLFHI